MKCSHCSKPAIIDLRYAGRCYCKDHFCRLTWRRFKKTVNDNKLFERGQKVAIAVSGGKDSAVCLYLMKDLVQPLKLELSAITVDEGIKQTEKSVLETTKKFCKEMDVEQKVVTFKKGFGKTMDEIAAKNKANAPCYYCGVLRRHLLNKTAREMGADVIATGHNLDDEAQAILMNFMRGNSLRLFRIGPKVGIKAYGKFVARVKPLRLIPERESAVFALCNEIWEYNRRDCPYVTQSFRDSLRSHLNKLEAQFPGTKIAIVNTFDEMKKGSAKDVPPPKPCPKCGELTSSNICKTCKILEAIL